MRLLNTLRLLARSTPPDTGVAPGAIYYDSTDKVPKYNDGTSWQSFGGASGGFPEDNTTTYTVPDNRQVMYFDQFTNDGIVVIAGTGILIGIR